MLLVLHRAVPSEAAKRLTTGMFVGSAADATIGTGEALRCSMLELIQDEETMYVRPMFWAPFMVVGEGAIHCLVTNQ